MLIVQNEKMLDLIKYNYTVEKIHKIVEFLDKKNTLNFFPLSTGLFSAAVTTEETEYTGYQQVWVRDNIHVAHAHYVFGDYNTTIKNLNSLMEYFKNYRQKFERIICFPSLANNVMERPHVRFDGEKLQEINEKWSHAQNDALGYFLWLYCKLLNEDLLIIEKENIDILALFPLYFNAISYWKDEDSGHWEEERKIEASSIGVVIAGLKAIKNTFIKYHNISQHLVYKNEFVTIDFLDKLIQKGTNALNEILPYECKEAGEKMRKYDSALLFLVYPLEVVEGEMADQIVQNVINNLQGDYGIRRYLLDSFWAADYRTRLSPEQRTADISDDMSYRNSLIQEGQEAQWCIFDPIISVIFGLKFQQTQQEKYLKQQIFYLNRSLGQITEEKSRTGEFKCPELYYLEDGKYMANDATPLLWTQANLRIALKKMEENLL
ncbi:glycoside hydrolase family 15 protein [Aphanothece sacrum]|nr:glycoside hydrolase family 15 protein [Aphanothece sacrum]